MLDKVLTLAIGRNTQDGTPLSDYKWRKFQTQARGVLSEYATVVAHTRGRGVGSDDDNNGKPEQSAIIVAINPRDAQKARERLAQLLPEYGQGSAAFSYDEAHEPVFATSDGFRTA